MAGERRPPRDLPGLQPERTELAWERTALGILVSGVFLLLRQEGSLTRGRVLLAGCALLMGVMAAVTGWRRGRRIRAARAGTERPTLPEPNVEVLSTGLVVAAFAAGAAAVLLH
jgi:uncharacterized membrane protein YidH (DUF202 family)